MVQLKNIIAIVDKLRPAIGSMLNLDEHPAVSIAIDNHKEELVNQDYGADEDKSGWFGKYWVPVLMSLLLLIIAVNYLIIPIVSLFTPIKPYLLPESFWTLLIIVVPTHLGLQTISQHVPNVLDKFKKKD